MALAKVKIEVLKNHFKTTYRLTDDQIDIMLKSSASSVSKLLTELYSALDNDSGYEELTRLGHTLKGLFLNMGENEWAEVARDIEVSAIAGQKKDYRQLVEYIRDGVEEIIEG